MCDPAEQLLVARDLWQWEPHPTQKEWLLCRAKTRVAACGRRWGKTEAAAIDAATMAVVAPGSVQMVVSPTYDQSRLIFDYVERLLLGCRKTRRYAKVVRTPYPRLTIFGSLIMARTADEDGRNLRGHSADRVIVDEAAYVRDTVIHEVIGPMLADRNGMLVLVSTPFGKNHFYRSFVRGQDAQQSRYASFCFPSTANPHISAEYIEEQRREISPRQFAVEYEARFIDDQNAVFPLEEIEAAALRYAFGHSAEGDGPQEHDAIVAGIDWARYSDYTAVIAVGVTDGMCSVTGMDHFNAMGWSRQIDRVADFLARHRVSAALTDANSIGDPLLEQLRERLWESGLDLSVEGYTFTNSSKRELVEDLALRFARASIAIPRDPRLMRELQFFEYELTDAGNVRLGARSGCHDDLVIALALACRQARSVGRTSICLAGNRRMSAAGWH